MKARRRKCKSCREWFKPVADNHWACKPECGVALAKAAIEKAHRFRLREAKAKAKTRGDHLREAQAAFNKWIRLRDKDLPCVSCGRHHEGQYHAGHYRSIGGSPALRFDEANCHKQCAPCNNWKHGNLTPYRVELLKRIGADEVARLEGPQEPLKLTIDELKRLKAKYMKLAREEA